MSRQSRERREPRRTGVRRRGEGGRPVRRRGAVALPSVVAGVGMALSLPPWGFWVLAFPAAGLLFWRLDGLPARTRLWAGWCAGLGLFALGLMWAQAFTLVGAIVLIAVEALFPALGCLFTPRNGPVRRALAFPAAMTLSAAGRMRWPFGGLPLGGVFLGQADGPVLNVARLGGPLLLTAVVFVGGVAVAALVEVMVYGGRLRRVRAGAGAGAASAADGAESSPPAPEQPGSAPRGSPAGARTRLLVGGVALAVVIVATVGGAVGPDGGPARGVLTAAAIQGGGKRGLSKEQVNPATVYAAQLAATAEMQRLDHGHAPQMVLWPEDVVSLSHPLAGSHAERALGALARRLHTTLIAGVTATVSSTHFRNEAVAWGPNGAEVAHYEKVHRVPFGEYIPYRGFFKHIANLSKVPLNAIPGHKSGLLRTPAGPIGTMISFEVFFADRGRSAVRAGADVLILPTNTSSYANAQVPTQEVAASEIQAVEEGRNLLQAAPTGYSAVISNRGALLQRSVLGRRQVLFADLPRRTGLTLYVRYGDVPVFALAVLALLLGWAAGLGRRQGRRRHGRPQQLRQEPGADKAREAPTETAGERHPLPVAGGQVGQTRAQP